MNASRSPDIQGCRPLELEQPAALVTQGAIVARTRAAQSIAAGELVGVNDAGEVVAAATPEDAVGRALGVRDDSRPEEILVKVRGGPR